MGESPLFRVGDDVELWLMLFNLTVLAVAVTAFENALHALETHLERYPKYLHMLTKIYRELMILGLLGLGIKMLKEAGLLKETSPETVAFVSADLTLFFLALALIFQAITIFLQLRWENKHMATLELLGSEELYTRAAAYERQQRLQSPFVRLWTGRRFDAAVQVRILRHLFLRAHALPEIFPFAKYLREAQDNQISHMIDVELLMWVVVFGVAWAFYASVNGLNDLGLFGTEAANDDVVVTGVDTDAGRLVDAQKHYALAVVFSAFVWLLLLLHVLVSAAFDRTLRKLLHQAGVASPAESLERLKAVAADEAAHLASEVTGAAIGRMQDVLEEQQVRQHEHHQHHRHRASEKPLTGLRVPGFSWKRWHFCVMLFLILNGLFSALFVQAVMYHLPSFASALGVVATVFIPLPLAVNWYVQPKMIRKFILVSSLAEVHVGTLSSVISSFTESVELQNSFISLLLGCLEDAGVSVDDLELHFQATDANHSGWIDVEDLRRLLGATIGFHMSFFKFTAVMQLLFQVQHLKVDYRKVLMLVRLASSHHDDEAEQFRATNHSLAASHTSNNHSLQHPHHHYQNHHHQQYHLQSSLLLSESQRGTSFIAMLDGSVRDFTTSAVMFHDAHSRPSHLTRQMIAASDNHSPGLVITNHRPAPAASFISNTSIDSTASSVVVLPAQDAAGDKESRLQAAGGGGSRQPQHHQHHLTHHFQPVSENTTLDESDRRSFAVSILSGRGGGGGGGDRTDTPTTMTPTPNSTESRYHQI